MLLVVEPSRVNEVSDILTLHGETVFTLGRLAAGSDSSKDPNVVYTNEAALSV